jgi:hypothetical protein
MKTSAILAAVLAAGTLAATVPAAADWIDDRQARQMQRIEQGLRSGQLTRSEYNRLMEQQREIARLERVLERDGHLSYSDRLRLTMLQNEAGRSIFWEKHDAETQYNRSPDRGWGYGWGRGWGNGWGWGTGWGWGRGWYRNDGRHDYDYRPSPQHNMRSSQGQHDRDYWHRRWWAAN